LKPLAAIDTSRIFTDYLPDANASRTMRLEYSKQGIHGPEDEEPIEFTKVSIYGGLIKPDIS
jgi:hypothetical protein